MRRWHRVALAALLIALVSAIGWQFRRDREPTYLGKPYSLWLKKYRMPEAYAQRLQAEKALREIGPKGIPILLRMIGSSDSQWKSGANRLLQRQSLTSFRFPPAEEERLLAFAGFECLGENATTAVPSLVRLLADRDRGVRLICVSALRVIGPESEQAIRALAKCSNDTDEDVRHSAIIAVGETESHPEIVIPALIANLRSPHPFLASIEALAMIRQAAMDAEPAVSIFLTNSDVAFRESATNALKAIDPKRAAELGVK